MGLNKLIRTAWTNGWTSPLKSERAACAIAIRFEKERREFYRKREEGHSEITPFLLQASYVGNVPTESGNYMMVDILSKYTMIIKLFDDHGRMRLSSSSCLLTEFNQSFYRWFRFPSLISEDIEMIKKLPIVKATD